MAILESDIKILKSAVMADVPEGGGAMTGIPVIDGQSNNLFPDTSAMDRAFGRVNIRKLFGVAHTDDTDTLMGAHAIVTQAPADPLVHCTLMRTPGWADTRAVAQDGIEKYLVKGPRLVFRLWDTHYSGSLIVKLICMVAGTPPAGGDAIVLRNPNGQEQYVRILRVSTAMQQVAVVEGNGTVLVNATVATCEIGNPLESDFLGPPALRVGLSEAVFAQVFSTNIAGGARFYGIKTLGVSGIPGDLSVMAAGGIYTPVVPAATVESPLLDRYPLTLRSSISRTALQAATLTSSGVTLAAGKVIVLPTAIEPGSLSMNFGGTVFADDGAGGLKQGSTLVGAINYADKAITMGSGSPNYGSATCEVTYRPATLAGLATHSAGVKVTPANQGLVYTQAMTPPPGPGSLAVHYMAQGKWYTLQDNANGKIVGADSSYGTGSCNYGTGSVGITLGAMPDVDSKIVYQWGDAAAAAAYTGAVPARLSSTIPVADYDAKLSTMVLSWTHKGAARSATCSSGGTLSGHATGKVSGGLFAVNEGMVQQTWMNIATFSPQEFPDGDVLVTWSREAASSSEAAQDGALGAYQLEKFPVAPGSITLTLGVVPENGFELPSSIYVTDNGLGVLVAPNAGSAAVGSVNYTTGKVQLYAQTGMSVYERIVQSYPWYGGTQYYETRTLRGAHTVNLINGGIISIYHRQAGAGEAGTKSVTPTAWALNLPVPRGMKLRISHLLMTVGGEVYSADAGVLSKGWGLGTGGAEVASAGAVTDAGLVSVQVLPGSGLNAIALFNASLNRVDGLSVGQGIFVIPAAPLKVGVFQIQSGEQVGSAGDSGTISGGGWTGTVDYQRGIVEWIRTTGYAASGPWVEWYGNGPIAADSLSYNAVFLQYLPLDKALLGIDTVRLPLDGKVPIFRTGDLVVVHHTLTTQLPNPLVKGTAYPLGRERIASVRVKDVLGAVVPSSLYVSDLNPGLITFPAESNITGFSQPFTVEHRIEDMMLCSAADISGQLKFTRSLTHDFPAGTSFVSSALAFGDLFARVYSYVEQITWTGAWSDNLIGEAPLANFNEGQYPAVTTNRGAITERWALIFTGSSTTVRVVGESVGDIGTFPIVNAIAPINPATNTPYFTLPALGWGNGWAAGNVLRFNTAACGAPFSVIRTVLQGPATFDSDVFSLAFRSDVDRP